jgi:astacin (peptidase family M12A)
MSNGPKICFDRVLPRDELRFQRVVQRETGLEAIMPIGKLWMNGSTLRVHFIDGTNEQRAIAKDQAKWWTQHANLNFDFNGARDAEIRITFDPSDGAWSYVGTDCKTIPHNEPTMNLGFLDGGTAAHEFGHAIGLAHEHQNPDGGIEWNEEVVIRELAGPPNFWNEAKARHNVLRKYSVNQIKGSKFDPHSIMLYFFPARWTLNNRGTEANEILSNMDKSFIAGELAYPKTAPTVNNAVELQINAGQRTQASIGKPGEEDLFKFSVTNDRRYIIDTQGKSDVVMKLFGPDSETALIAEDDDSGVEWNARIIADLIPGRYYAQVRHYSTTRGTGKYSIKVSTG